jgi:hypothetical protein
MQNSSRSVRKHVLMAAPPPVTAKSIYRGSQKHKDRPTGEKKGTLCPEWTHSTPDGGYAHDPFKHKWERTAAHTLFAAATIHEATQRRYATDRGIAFEAKETNDGTWHGYPVPWVSVPHDIVDQWVSQKKITRKVLRQKIPKDSIRWAME